MMCCRCPCLDPLLAASCTPCWYVPIGLFFTGECVRAQKQDKFAGEQFGCMPESTRAKSYRQVLQFRACELLFSLSYLIVSIVLVSLNG